MSVSYALLKKDLRCLSRLKCVHSFICGKYTFYIRTLDIGYLIITSNMCTECSIVQLWFMRSKLSRSYDDDATSKF